MGLSVLSFERRAACELSVPHACPWTQSEKKIGRKAFDWAFEKQCASIKSEAEKMIANATAPLDIWRVHDYLPEHRRIDAPR